MTSNLDLKGDAYPPFERFTWDYMQVRLLPPSAGPTQQSALQPETVAPGLNWLFDNFPSSLWFDPPTTSELTFEMISETLYTTVGVTRRG